MQEKIFKEVFLADYQAASYEVPTIKLDFDIRSEEDVRVKSSMEIKRVKNSRAQQERSAITLHGSKEHITLKSLKIDGRELSHNDYVVAVDGLLTIDNVPSHFTLDIESTLNPKANTRCMGLYVSEGIFCTQCESESFRNISYALDRPDVYSTFNVTVEADAHKYTQLLSNGLPVNESVIDGRRKVTWIDDRPKPVYLFALCVGDFDVLTDSFTYPNGREVSLQYFVNKGDAPKVEWAMACLKDAMEHEYSRWGHAYHSASNLFMTLAVDAFVFGAMENTGLNIFNASFVLASPDTTTDAKYARIDTVVNHEFDHDETGNHRVPSSWFQISYKEGLTVLREQTYAAYKYGHTVQRIADVINARATVFAYDSGPMTHPMVLSSYIKTDNNYDVITYPKGAEINRMVQTLVGIDAFKKAYRDYHDVQETAPATIKGWLAHVAESTGKDLTQFIDTWLTQAGVPTLIVSTQFDDENNTYALKVEQSIPATSDNPEQAKQPFHIPFIVGLVGKDGKDIELSPADDSFIVRQDGMIEITKSVQTFTFGNIINEPLPSLNRDFSAYCKVDYQHSRDSLTFLAANDSNQLNRWDAVQQLGVLVFNEAIEAVKNYQPVTVDTQLVEVFKAVLLDESLDNALKVEMLSLPLQNYMANLQKTGTKDPVVIFQANKALTTQIGQALEHEFKALYDSSNSSAEYTPSPEEIGRRALMNLSLGYLVSANSADYSEVAKAQFYRQRNYNDVLQAVTILVNSENRKVADDALHGMYEKYKDNNLVMNDWLLIQAQAKNTSADDIRGLLASDVFSYENPNKVTALLNGFAVGNKLNFHADDGLGYALIADQIIKLDGINPVVAARLASSFTSAPEYIEQYCSKMVLQLERILLVLDKTISENVYEVVSKTLEKASS